MGEQGTRAVIQIEDETELTFAAIIRRLWRARTLIVMIPLLAALAASAVIFAINDRERQIISYHVKLVGIAKGAYPNGTAFSPDDLKSPAVLTTLSEKFGLNPQALEAALSIDYGTPGSKAIDLKYQQKLATRGLSLTAIDSINSAYLAELGESIRSGVRIEVNNTELKMHPEDAVSLALAIPQTWNEVYLKQFRVLADTNLSDFVANDIPPILSGSARLVLAGEQLSQIDSGLNFIAEDNRLSNLTTPEGLSASDLVAQVEAFRAINYDPLVADGFLATDTFAASKKKRMELQIEDIKRQIKGLDENLAHMTGDRSLQSANLTPPDGTALEQGTIQTILDLVKRASDLEYTKALLEDRQTLVRKMSVIQSRMDSIILRETGDTPAVGETLSVEAEAELVQLVAKYKSLFSAAEKQLRIASGKFYVIDGSLATTRQSHLLMSAGVILAAALAGLLIALVYALLGPTVRQAISEKKPVSKADMRAISAADREGRTFARSA